MKKMSVLAILVLAISVTAFSVAGTYAKYTSTKTISDSARVAKWSIGALNEVNLFSDSYVGVDSDDDSKVIAPGTSGTYAFALSGSVETNYTIDAVVTANETNGLAGRIVYTLKDGDDTIYSGNSISALATAIDGLYNPETIYAAGTFTGHTYTIEWEWVFEKTTKDAEDNDILDTANDTTDTNLGIAATSTTADEVPSVSITVDLVVTQSNQVAS